MSEPTCPHCGEAMPPRFTTNCGAEECVRAARRTAQRHRRAEHGNGSFPCAGCGRGIQGLPPSDGAPTYCPLCSPPGHGRMTKPTCGLCGTQFWRRNPGHAEPNRAWLCDGCADTHKWCGTCERIRRRENFSGARGKRDGLTGRCRDCASRVYRAQPTRERQTRTLRRFHITLDRYDEMLAVQNGLCAVCRRPPSPPRGLAVDHDHRCCPGDYSCGRCVRSLLCMSCNVGIGNLRDDSALLRAAAAYLDSFTPTG